VIIFNETEIEKTINLILDEKSVDFVISAKAIQTVVIPKTNN